MTSGGVPLDGEPRPISRIRAATPGDAVGVYRAHAESGSGDALPWTGPDDTAAVIADVRAHVADARRAPAQCPPGSAP
jgi:hypothetical protein